MRQNALLPLVLGLGLALALLAGARAEPPSASAPAPAAVRVAVPKALIHHDDGDSFEIRWPGGAEVVRILGIDTPETAHPEHDIPYAQPFGEAAAGFLRGCMAMTERVDLLRAADKDPYGRTLAYVFLDGRNYSALVIEARLAVENVGHFGDNGFATEAAVVLGAAKRAGPVPFEAPYRFRARMRRVSAWLKGPDAGARDAKEPTDETPK